MIQNNKNQELLEKLQQTQNIIASGTLMLNEEQNQKIDNQFEQLKLIIKPFEEKLIMLSNESLKIIKRFKKIRDNKNRIIWGLIILISIIIYMIIKRN